MGCSSKAKGMSAKVSSNIKRLAKKGYTGPQRTAIAFKQARTATHRKKK